VNLAAITFIEEPVMDASATITTSAIPYRGADGRYHYLYVTYDEETFEWYGGKHSSSDLDDGYIGSGLWIKLHPLPERLITQWKEFFDSEEAAYAAERKWLTFQDIDADPLCRNAKEGGVGLTSEAAQRFLARPDVKARHSASIRRSWADNKPMLLAGMQARFALPEVRAKQSASALVRWDNPERKAQLSAAMRTGHARPEVKAKERAVHNRPETRAKHGVASKANWADPEWRANMLAALARPEVKKRKAATARATMVRPEVKAKASASLKAAHARPEVKARHRAAIKAALATPEMKAKRSASMKAAWAARKKALALSKE
jgi:hypothetical protein